MASMPQPAAAERRLGSHSAAKPAATTPRARLIAFSREALPGTCNCVSFGSAQLTHHAKARWQDCS